MGWMKKHVYVITAFFANFEESGYENPSEEFYAATYDRALKKKAELESNPEYDEVIISDGPEERELWEPERTRQFQAKVRLTEVEMIELQKSAAEAGMSQQEYMRRAVLQAPIMDTEGIKEMLPEMKRIGNNLNQIAKALNERGYYKYDLITQNQKELSELWQQLRQFLQARK